MEANPTLHISVFTASRDILMILLRPISFLPCTSTIVTHVFIASCLLTRALPSTAPHSLWWPASKMAPHEPSASWCSHLYPALVCVTSDIWQRWHITSKIRLWKPGAPAWGWPSISLWFPSSLAPSFSPPWITRQWSWHQVIDTLKHPMEWPT